MYTKGGQAVAMLNKAIWKTFQDAMDYGDNYSCCQFIATAAACVFRRLLSAALYLTVSHWFSWLQSRYSHATHIDFVLSLASYKFCIDTG